MQTLLVSSLFIALSIVACGGAAPNETTGDTVQALEDSTVGTQIAAPAVDAIATPSAAAAASALPEVDGVAAPPGVELGDTPLVAEKDKIGGSGGTGTGQTYCKMCHTICLPGLKNCGEECITVSCSKTL